MRRHRIGAIVRRHLYEARHNPDRLADACYWPVIDVLMWGFFTLSIMQMTHRLSNLTQSLLASAIVWCVFRAVQRDMASGFLAELWSRNLVNLLATPLSIGEYMTGLLTIALAKALLGMALAGLIAWAFYGANLLARLPIVLPFLVEMVVFAVSIGVFVIALVCRFSTRVEGLAWNLTGILMPLSCVFYPVHVLPPWLQNVAVLLPTTHVFQGVRTAVEGGGFAPLPFIQALGLDVAYIVASLMLFRSNLDAARANGMLVRFE